MANFTYQTDELVRFYSSNRVRWDQFYPSERVIFDEVAKRFGPPRTVLDAGCAVGGLGLALQERFGSLEVYTGVDSNRQVIALAERQARPWQQFVCADVATASLPKEAVQWVVSLGCADWSMEPVSTIHHLWGKVAPDGFLIVSLRLTNVAGMCDPATSYQRISFFDDSKSAETAPYVVFNVTEAIGLLGSLGPDLILGYGYWGPPSRTAVTPYERLVFTVFALHRPVSMETEPAAPRIELRVPADLLAGLRPGDMPRVSGRT